MNNIYTPKVPSREKKLQLNGVVFVLQPKVHPEQVQVLCVFSSVIFLPQTTRYALFPYFFFQSQVSMS